ncbi:MAG: helix-turn-helix transcriptional regulator [Minicystis sp.]
MSEDPDALLTQLGLRVVRRREALGLSQKELAGKLGIAAPYLSRIEYGQQNLTFRTLCKLADALEMTLAELITGTPPTSER